MDEAAERWESGCQVVQSKLGRARCVGGSGGDRVQERGECEGCLGTEGFGETVGSVYVENPEAWSYFDCCVAIAIDSADE